MAVAAIGAGGTVAGAATPTGPSVAFAVKGDWGDGTPGQRAVTRRICAEHRRASFAAVITTGDNFSMPDGVATRENYWRPERCILRLGIPYRPAWGNHDIAGSDTAEVLGAPGRHYAFTQGPARVVILDANRPDDPGQLEFLRREMTAPGRAVRIVAFHQPVYTAGIHAPGEVQQRLWVPLFRRGGVRLVLQGHNHAYERIERDGITYITTGGGGAAVFPCVRRTEGLRACRVAHHFLALTAGAAALRVRAIDARGRLIEDITIPSGG